MKNAILHLSIWCCFSLFTSCHLVQQDVIPESCYQEAGLISWTINGVPQEPGNSIEPNSGINLDYLYALDKFGSWSINFFNDEYMVTFADFDYLISAKELDRLSEAEWEATLEERGAYDFVYEAEGRQELTLSHQGQVVFVGDSPEEVLGGEVKITILKTSICKFLVLDLTAILGYEGETYTVKISLQEPYIYP